MKRLILAFAMIMFTVGVFAQGSFQDLRDRVDSNYPSDKGYKFRTSWYKQAEYDSLSDIFYELIRLVEDSAATGSYWPLGGSESLTGSVTMDGSDVYNVSYNNMNGYSVSADNYVTFLATVGAGAYLNMWANANLDILSLNDSIKLTAVDGIYLDPANGSCISPRCHCVRTPF